MDSAAPRLLLPLLLWAWPAPAASEGHIEEPGTNFSGVGGVKDDAVKMIPGSSVSAMMLGSVVFIMSLTYLVHWPERDIRVITWKLTSSTTSIFIAVMLNTVMVHFVKVNICTHMQPGLVWFFMLFALWLGVQAFLFLTRRNRIAITARATVGGHILGFTAIHVFGTLQEHPLFRDEWRPLIVLPLFFVVWFAFSWVAGRLRTTVEDRMVRLSSDAQEGEAEEQWEDQCQDSENDTVCITLGFLLTQVIGSAITGELPPLEGEPSEPHDWQNHILFAAAGLLMIAVFVFEAMEHEEHSQITKRLFSIVRGVLAMSMSWCWLFWGRWHLWRTVKIEELLAKVTLACSMSALSMWMIFLLNTLANRGILNPRALRAVIQAFGLLVGMGWEACFDACMEDLHPKSKKYVAAFALAVFVLPGWRLYILPKAMEVWRPEHYTSPPSATTLCIDEETVHPSEDDDDSADLKKGSSEDDSES